MEMHRWYVIARWPTELKGFCVVAGPFDTHAEVILALFERTAVLRGMEVTVADVVFPAEYLKALKEKSGDT